MRQVLLDPNLDPEGLWVAEDGENVVGFCVAIARRIPLENSPADADSGYVTALGVHPESRRKGIGTELLQGAEAFLGERGRKLALISPYSPGYFAPGVEVAAYSEGLEFLKARKYAEVYRPVSMQATLADLNTPPWVDAKLREFLDSGGDVAAWYPELTLPLLSFALHEFGGDWARYVREAVGDIVDGGDPNRLVAAYERSTRKVLGFSHYDGERFGPIGVAKDAQGRGLGHVLMFRTLEAQRRRGLRGSWFLWSDDETARRLYDSAGFREVRRFAVLKKEL